MEVGLLTDFYLVIHAIQPAPDGVFELADRPDSVLVEARLQNAGSEPVPDCTPVDVPEAAAPTGSMTSASEFRYHDG